MLHTVTCHTCCNQELLLVAHTTATQYVTEAAQWRAESAGLSRNCVHSDIVSDCRHWPVWQGYQCQLTGSTIQFPWAHTCTLNALTKHFEYCSLQPSCFFDRSLAARVAIIVNCCRKCSVLSFNRIFLSNLPQKLIKIVNEMKRTWALLGCTCERMCNAWQWSKYMYPQQHRRRQGVARESHDPPSLTRQIFLIWSLKA